MWDSNLTSCNRILTSHHTLQPQSPCGLVVYWPFDYNPKWTQQCLVSPPVLLDCNWETWWTLVPIDNKLGRTIPQANHCSWRAQGLMNPILETIHLMWDSRPIPCNWILTTLKSDWQYPNLIFLADHLLPDETVIFICVRQTSVITESNLIFLGINWFFRVCCLTMANLHIFYLFIKLWWTFLNCRRIS